MDLISELNSEYNTEEIKTLLPIGLFGSFGRELLEILKNHLINQERFHANISYDLQTRYPQIQVKIHQHMIFDFQKN